MAAFRKQMVDMARTPDEKMQNMLSSPDASDYPSGLCIYLDETDLEKLDLEDDASPGDTIHLMAMARLTSISKKDGKCRLELQLEQLSVEDEDLEDSEEEAAEGDE